MEKKYKAIDTSRIKSAPQSIHYGIYTIFIVKTSFASVINMYEFFIGGKKLKLLYIQSNFLFAYKDVECGNVLDAEIAGGAQAG